MPTPYPFAATVDKTYHHCGHGGAPQHHQCGFGIFVYAYQLPVECGRGKGQKGPAGPAQPTRNRQSQAMAAGPFRQGAFRTQYPAPDSPQQHHADHHERPPDAPEHKLSEQGEVLIEVHIVRRQGKERRVNQQAQI